MRLSVPQSIAPFPLSGIMLQAVVQLALDGFQAATQCRWRSRTALVSPALQWVQEFGPWTLKPPLLEFPNSTSTLLPIAKETGSAPAPPPTDWIPIGSTRYSGALGSVFSKHRISRHCPSGTCPLWRSRYSKAQNASSEFTTRNTFPVVLNFFRPAPSMALSGSQSPALPT